MALTVTVSGRGTSTVIVKETALNNAGVLNVVGGSCTLYSLNATSADGSNANYIKLYDATTATASTAPDFIVPIASNGTVDMTVVGGLAFSTGLSLRASREAGTGGTTSPGGNVTVYVVAR